jgi:hypothetical protein
MRDADAHRQRWAPNRGGHNLAPTSRVAASLR